MTSSVSGDHFVTAEEHSRQKNSTPRSTTDKGRPRQRSTTTRDDARFSLVIIGRHSTTQHWRSLPLPLPSNPTATTTLPRHQKHQTTSPSPNKLMKLRIQSVLLVTGTATLTWLMATWLAFVQTGHLQALTDQIMGGSGTNYPLDGSNCPGSGGKATNDGPSKSKKRKIWANLSRIDTDPDIPSRVFPPFQNPFPCFPGEKLLQLVKPAHQGILFQRPLKTGTTTTAGIVMRLAHNRYERLSPDEQSNFTAPRCKHRSNHGRAIDLEYHLRNRSESFVFSLIRDPTARAISQFFHFDVSVGQVEPTDFHFQHHLQRSHYSNAYLTDLTMDPNIQPPLHRVIKPYNSTHPPVMIFPRESGGGGRGDGAGYQSVVQNILDSYDFIMVSERLHESLVVLKLILNLRLDEILYLQPARSAGSFSNGPPKERPCLYIIPSFITPGMQDFLEHGKRWRQQVEGDELLYLAATKSLDRTIDALGRDRVQKTMERFLKLQEYAQQQCSGKNDVASMCSEAGIPNRKTTCYIWGEGCDHQCLNNITFPPHMLEE